MRKEYLAAMGVLLMTGNVFAMENGRYAGKMDGNGAKGRLVSPKEVISVSASAQRAAQATEAENLPRRARTVGLQHSAIQDKSARFPSRKRAIDS
ncbi:hypothetical protein FHS21_005714 [Phyllobacterium trifolii]|uniref:Uncharacterized protein n=1 Tax=Phyllobacterium trifolii TaxID=300193 RepID=A0A839UKK6_9HYPH|nr:hypothetical protein [Phyllobacterium trifolii]